MWDINRGFYGAANFPGGRVTLFLVIALCAVALLASCQSTESAGPADLAGSTASGNIRVVGHPMKPVARRWYWGNCLSEFLLPYQFSGVLEGTAIVAESVSRDGACGLAPSAVEQNRHALGTFTGEV